MNTHWQVTQPSRASMCPVLEARRVLQSGIVNVSFHELRGNETPALMLLLIRAIAREVEDAVSHDERLGIHAPANMCQAMESENELELIP